MPGEPMPDLMVLIPGIGGSMLARDGKPIWAPQAGAALRAVLTLGKSIKTLTLAGDDPALDDLGDGVTATALLPDLHVLPGLDWKIDGYGLLRTRLFERFDLREGENYLELPYDWRRDNRVAARKLARLSRAQLDAWKRVSGNPGAKLILVGHSMGGIVARLFLEFEEGWRITRRLVTFGTPYSGSINALEFLVNGFRPGWGPVEFDFSAMLRSFTSVYQLLPSYRCVRDAGEWKPIDELAWPAVLDKARMDQALALHRKLREAVNQAGPPLDRYDIRPLVGDVQRTRYAAQQLSNGELQVLYERAQGETGGDGTVPRLSAMPHELLTGWRNAAYFGEKHASLQNDGAAFEHLSGVLRTQLVGGPPVFPAASVAVALEAADVSTEQPLRLRAPPQGPVPELQAELTAIGSGVASSVPLVQQASGWWEASVEGLSAGDYRARVQGPGIRSVTALASVIDLQDVAQALDP